MNPSPENGSNGDLSRRDFLRASAAAGAVTTGSLGAFYFGYETSVPNPVRVAILGTGDEGNVLIGGLNPDFLQVTAIADIRPYNQHRAFYGDYSSDAALAARPGLLAKYGWRNRHEAEQHVKVYQDYRELLAGEPDIEAVIIALPLHLHAPAAIAAMRAGKHVLTEKLMGQTVHACKEMARVAKETGLHLATGHQRHYNILYEEAVDTIRRGVLGDLHYIRAQWHRGNMPGADSWQQPMPKSIKPTDHLAVDPKDPKKEKDAARGLVKRLESWTRQLKAAGGRDIDLWRKRVAQVEAQIAEATVGDLDLNEVAQKYGYQADALKDAAGNVVKDAAGNPVYEYPAAEELIRWRLWDRTGGGLMAELGSHQLDAASIFISAAHDGHKQYPLSVAAAGNRPIFPPDRDVDDHVCCMFEFPAPGYDAEDPIASRRKIGVQYASINGNGFGGYGEMVYGTQGTLILEREQEVTLFRGPGAAKIGAAAGPALDTQASGAAQKAEAGATRQVSRGYREELEHWAWCIRNPAPENQPRCHPKVALGDAVIALVTNDAAREGKRVEFDPEWFDPDSDATPEGVKPDLSGYEA